MTLSKIKSKHLSYNAFAIYFLHTHFNCTYVCDCSLSEQRVWHTRAYRYEAMAKHFLNHFQLTMIYYYSSFKYIIRNSMSLTFSRKNELMKE